MDSRSYNLLRLSQSATLSAPHLIPNPSHSVGLGLLIVAQSGFQGDGIGAETPAAKISAIESVPI